VHVGYGLGRTHASVLGLDITPTPDPDGWFGGTSIGYNWQFNQVVLGVEADFNYGQREGQRHAVFSAWGIARRDFKNGSFLHGDEVSDCGILMRYGFRWNDKGPSRAAAAEFKWVCI